MKKILLILLCLPMLILAQQTSYVPDANFEASLEANGMGNNIPNDSNVFTSAIDTVTSLNVYNENISDLTGIEDFTALIELDCGDNQITSLDVSQNTALTSLECFFNQLTSLDVSNNTALTELLCDDNQLTILDVSNNTALTYLACDNNQLTSLDVINNIALTYLDCSSNQLISLDLSNNIALGELGCNNNLITSLDVSNNTALTNFQCYNNFLTNLDVRNGNNTSMLLFHSYGNLSLYCIDVDNVSWSTANWTNIDSSALFSANCDWLPAENLFFSEYAEGSSDNKYFEIYNPTSDTVDLTNYAFARVNGNPATPGIYEYWNDFDSGAVILPNDVYIVADQAADSIILNEADMGFGSLSNGDDGMALVYGNQPPSPISSDSGAYVILDWIGDWIGDPGQGWDVAGVGSGTRNHTLVRKCDVLQGDTSWTNAAGTNPVNSQWIVLGNNDWSDIGQHIILPCVLIYGCTDSLACNYDFSAVIDDGSCFFSGQIFQQTITICDGDSIVIGNSVYNTTGIFSDTIISAMGCDSIVETSLTIYSQTLLYDTIFGGITDTTIGGGNFYSGSQHLELSCYESSELISVVIYSQDTTLTTFEIRDNNGNVLDDITVNIIPGGHRVYFNYQMSVGTDYQLGVNGSSNDLFRNNSGVNYPYNFGSLASVISSSAGGSYYYFFYDIEVRQSPTLYSICAGESITVAGNVYNTTGLYTDSLISSLGCDSLAYSSVIVYPTASYTNSQTICNGEIYVINGNTYDSSGVYIDSLQTVASCDSIVVTNLTVLNILASIVNNNITICNGDSILVDTNYYSTSGTYIDTLENSAGCDSIVTTNLTVQTPTYQDIAICDGNSILVGNSVYNSSGSYTDTMPSSIGCDSIIHTNLIIYSQFNSIYGGIPNNIVGGGSFFSGQQNLELSCYIPSELVSAVIYSADTTLTTFEIRDDNGNVLDDTTVNIIPGGHRIYFNYEMLAGSDYQLGVNGGSNDLFRNNSGVNYPYNLGSLAAIISSSAGANYYYFFYDIEVKQSSQPMNYSICDGESITVAGNLYNTTGLYTDSLTSSIGCDSLVFTNLVVHPTVSYINNQTICSEEVYLIGDNAYDSTDVYIDSLQTVTGCDSIVTTQLTVLSISGVIGSNNQTICMGDSIVVGNNVYYNVGAYTDILTSANGCDSVVNTTLTVLPASIDTLTIEICDGDSVVVGNSIYALSGTYTDSLTNSYGCDSIVISQLTVLSVSGGVGNNNQTICMGDSIVVGNNVYYNVGVYTDILQTMNGCDSVVNTTLAVLPVSIDTLTIEICDGDSVVIGNNIYTLSGAYTDSLTNSYGCDSVIFSVLEVYQTSILTIGSVPNPAEICLGDSLVIEVTQGFINYWWNTGNPADQDENRVVVFPTQDFTYVVEALDSNGCEARAEIFADVDSCISGVEELSFEEGLQVYPNPASEQLTIDFTGNATSIKAYNMLGELMIEKYISEGQSSVQLFVKEWKGAMYSIQLYRENGTITHKVFTVVR